MVWLMKQSLQIAHVLKSAKQQHDSMHVIWIVLENNYDYFRAIATFLLHTKCFTITYR